MVEIFVRLRNQGFQVSMEYNFLAPRFALESFGRLETTWSDVLRWTGLEVDQMGKKDQFG